MEIYKKKIRIRIALLTLPVLIGFAVSIFDQFFNDQPIRNIEVLEFQIGVAMGIAILSSFATIRYCMILRDERRLKLEYNKENDERMKAIRAKAGVPFVLITSIVIVLVAIIAGYYNYVVFCTLMLVAMVQLIVSCIVKFIYMRVM